MVRRLVPAVVLLLLIAAPALAEEFTETFRFDRDDLVVINMIGHVEVVPAAGDEFEVTVNVKGDDATRDFLDLRELDGGKAFAVRFPLDEHKTYVYPELGSGSKTTMHFKDDEDHGNSWLRELFSGMSGTKVTVKGSGRGEEVWADLVIAVPEGAELEVRHGCGRIDAADIAGDLSLDTHSGGVTVRHVVGEVLVDTGSGHVEVVDVRGNLNVDTGSGHVELNDCTGDEIKVDTGSGHVKAEMVKCDYLNIDTGSGGVKARGVETDGARIDTGSGSVMLELDRMGGGKYVLDTGSGGIELVVPDGASAHISADTGSGSVDCELDGVEIHRKDRNEMELTVGDGEARVKLDAGSGHIKIREG